MIFRTRGGGSKGFITLYANVLERKNDFPIAYPESLLPCSKEILKEDIKKDLSINRKDESLVSLLKVAYAEIAHFIPDKDACAANTAYEKMRRFTDLSSEEQKVYMNSSALMEATHALDLKARLLKEANLLQEEIERYFIKIKKA